MAVGEKLATTDPDVADALATARIRELDGLRRGRALHGRAQGTPLAAYAAEHLEKKARAGKVTREWIAMAELFLRRAVAFFGAERELESIGVNDAAGVGHAPLRGADDAWPASQLGHDPPCPQRALQRLPTCAIGGTRAARILSGRGYDGQADRPAPRGEVV